MKKSEIEKLIERLHKHYTDAILKDQYNKHAMPLDCEFAADALKQLVAERDAAVGELKEMASDIGSCVGCKWQFDDEAAECIDCYLDNHNWEWRGYAVPADAVPVADRNEPAPAPDPMPVETREDILRRAAECVGGQRAQDYGKPENNFALIAKLWSAYRGIEFDAVDVAMMMALLKIARISGGNGTPDCFVDLAGYAACGGEIYAKGGAPIERR